MQNGKSKPASGKQRKMALGKGLGALIPKADPTHAPRSEREFIRCDITQIHPNRYQPRRHFPEAELAELSRSVREQGIIQPLVVRWNTEGYELVAGERRLRAARMAGLDQVPVIIRALSDAELLEISIVENIQRQDLNPIEESDAYHRLMDEFSLTQEQVAERVGKSRSAVANFLRLAQLPEEIRATLADGTLSMGHAKVLMGADTPALQADVWRMVIARGLSVRETENLLNRLRAEREKPEDPPPGTEEIYFRDLSENLSRRFGTKVQIRRRGKKGRVEIEFYSDDDLERLLSFLDTAS
ncbi:chromosome partitioning protein ParB [Desulfonema ishimotonii]|uniref:Chromosome partitioning protein ParB n=1 Tax=Desulfonema ishimotonii TaxID=45657 RepID=A0A401G4D4_9BACT|nr:ParB/RepB/Spo0J family partition protein [Desulfonema ishimotonii]GBC64099.1 chromosome partitioning protein ParB [Desulfonema ishimotonii]